MRLSDFRIGAPSSLPAERVERNASLSMANLDEEQVAQPHDDEGIDYTDIP
jgi:hypothetical protein